MSNEIESTDLETEGASITAPAPTDVVEFVSPENRFQTVPLKWPVRHQGKTYESITVRRVTAAEVATYVQQIAAGVSTAFPGIEAPAAVYAGLDDDDAAAVDKAVSDFLPQRLQAAFASLEPAGDPSVASSAT